MLKLLITKELRDILGSTKFAVTFGLCSVLVLLVFFVGARTYLTAVAQHDAAERENLRRLEGITDWANVQETRVFLPPQPLSVLVSGVANDIGQTVTVQGRGELTAQDSRFANDPMFAVFHTFDLDFLFQVVLSLLAILFSYDAISGEKERGTLRLTFASPVPRHLYITGKLIGSYLALIIPLLVPLLIGAVLLPLLGVPMGTDEWIRLALIVGAGCLYLGVFLSLSVAVSAMTSRSSASFLILLVLWIVIVLVLPRAAVMIAGRAVDVPSVDAIAAQKARYSQQLWTEDRAAMSGFAPAKTESPQEMMKEFQKMMQRIADTREKKMREFGGRLNEERRNKQEVQERLAFGIARLSPAACFSLAASRLAGTSLELKRHFLAAAETYQKSFAEFMMQKTGMNPGGSMIVLRIVEENGKTPEPINAHEMPAFTYAPISLAQAGGSALVEAGVLSIFILVFMAGAVAAFLRYDVR